MPSTPGSVTSETGGAPVTPHTRDRELVEYFLTAHLSSPSSLAVVVLKRLSENEPLYQTVIRHYKNSLHKFLESYPRDFHIWNYSQEEIVRLELSPYFKVEETRVAAARTVVSVSTSQVRSLDTIHDWDMGTAIALREEESSILTALMESLTRKRGDAVTIQRKDELEEMRKQFPKVCAGPMSILASSNAFHKFVLRHQDVFVCTSSTVALKQ
jgi:hypothetical protein